MTIAEQIHTIVSNLPQEQASKILSFAEIVHSSYLGTNLPTSAESKETDWQKLVYDLAGSWGEGFPSLEEIRTNSEDIVRESL